MNDMLMLALLTNQGLELALKKNFKTILRLKTEKLSWLKLSNL